MKSHTLKSEKRTPLEGQSPNDGLLRRSVLGLHVSDIELRIVAVVLVGVRLLLGPSQAAEPADPLFRVGFVSSMFADISEHDAQASVRAWTQTIARQHHIPTDSNTTIFRGMPATLQALRDRKVDAAGMSIVEYAALREAIRLDPIFATQVGRRVAEQYLLLTHQASGINAVRDLQGHRVGFHHKVKSGLALAWLDPLLAQERLKPVAEFAGKITRNPKIAATVLPVFFRQSDACVATRSGFETMVELNPEVGKQLKILATSPEFVPAVVGFRADYSPPFKEALLAGIRGLHLTPAGQQVFTVFQSEKLEERPVACLDGALALMEMHGMLRARIEAPRANAAAAPDAKGATP